MSVSFMRQYPVLFDAFTCFSDTLLFITELDSIYKMMLDKNVKRIIMRNNKRYEGGIKMYMIITLKDLKEQLSCFLREEDGVGVVEIILILVVLISLVAIFKNQLTSLVKSLLSKVTSESNGI